jgi:hypothetical protein
VLRDGEEIWELIVRDGAYLKIVTATYTTTRRQLDSCGSLHAQSTYSIRCVESRCFVERWENDFHRSNRDKVGFRKSINVTDGLEAFRKYAEVIKKLSSDTEEVVEVYEMISQYTRNFEVLENET